MCGADAVRGAGAAGVLRTAAGTGGVPMRKGELFSTPQIFPNYGKLSENTFFQTSNPEEYIGWDPHI
uniref:Uncharacterized protein n=1 Tax=Oryza rufipogon TaxID=4529 RepID=A0A0E0RB08_ORYRU